MLLKVIYGVFLLIIGAIFIFSKTTGRRHLVLSMAAGGIASFVPRLLYYGYDSAAITVHQALSFPFLVLGTWGVLTFVTWLVNR